MQYLVSFFWCCYDHKIGLSLPKWYDSKKINDGYHHAIFVNDFCEKQCYNFYYWLWVLLSLHRLTRFFVQVKNKPISMLYLFWSNQQDQQKGKCSADSLLKWWNTVVILVLSFSLTWAETNKSTEWVSEWVGEWVSEWVSEWARECVCVRAPWEYYYHTQFQKPCSNKIRDFVNIKVFKDV